MLTALTLMPTLMNRSLGSAPGVPCRSPAAYDDLRLCPTITRSPTLRHPCGSMLTSLLMALEGTSL